MELEGATIGAQSAKGVLDDLSIDTSNPSVSQVFWMDLFSMLWWIWSEKSLVTYCHDTVEKIRQNIFRGQWRLVPTEQNPADTICRGTKTVNKFLGSDLWFHGRRFLYLSRDVWPTNPQRIVMDVEAKREMIKAMKHLLFLVAQADLDWFEGRPWWDPDRFLASLVIFI